MRSFRQLEVYPSIPFVWQGAVLAPSGLAPPIREEVESFSSSQPGVKGLLYFLLGPYISIKGELVINIPENGARPTATGITSNNVEFAYMLGNIFGGFGRDCLLAHRKLERIKYRASYARKYMEFNENNFDYSMINSVNLSSSIMHLSREIVRYIINFTNYC